MKTSKILQVLDHPHEPGWYFELNRYVKGGRPVFFKTKEEAEAILKKWDKADEMIILLEEVANYNQTQSSTILKMKAKELLKSLKH